MTRESNVCTRITLGSIKPVISNFTLPVKVKVSVISAGIGWVSLSMRMTGYPFACELALTRASPVCAVCWWAWHSKYVRSTGYLHSLPTGYRKGAHLLSEAGGVASHD